MCDWWFGLSDNVRNEGLDEEEGRVKCKTDDGDVVFETKASRKRFWASKTQFKNRLTTKRNWWAKKTFEHRELNFKERNWIIQRKILSGWKNHPRSENWAPKDSKTSLRN